MDDKPSNLVLIGKGLYSVAEASRYANVPPTRITRWLRGRWRVYEGESVFDHPLWTSEIPDVDGQLNLSFRDLIELRIVDAFRQHGLSLPYLRKVVDAARTLLEDDHPFTSSTFKTDGKRVYYEVLSSTDEPKLVEVLHGQHAFHSIISVGLRDIEFKDGVASLWRPQSGRDQVILDPMRSFGQPILAESGISTAIIKLAFDSGRSAREISRDFEVPEKSVRSALAFETKLAA